MQLNKACSRCGGNAPNRGKLKRKPYEVFTCNKCGNHDYVHTVTGDVFRFEDTRPGPLKVEAFPKAKPDPETAKRQEYVKALGVPGDD